MRRVLRDVGGGLGVRRFEILVRSIAISCATFVLVGDGFRIAKPSFLCRPCGGRRQSVVAACSSSLGGGVGGVNVLLPIGPFCPFKSRFCQSKTMDEEIGRLQFLAGNLKQRMAPVMLDIQMGLAPGRELVKEVVGDMQKANELWKTLNARMLLSGDFQAVEFYRHSEAALEIKNFSMKAMEDAINWQVEAMVAYADGLPLPPPIQLPRNAASGASFGFMTPGPSITAMPFDPNSPTMQSEVVQAELSALASDHQGLVRLGETYGSFDSRGKLLFLDQIQDVEERWRIFLTRFQLTGDLNQEFVQQTRKYLRSSELSAAEYVEILKLAHSTMRRSASEQE